MNPMKISSFTCGILARPGFVALALLFIVSANCVAADTFSKFGVIRANIARSISDQQWLVCYDTKRGIEQNELLKSEVVGFNIDGSIFRIRGHLRPGADNLLSLESYDKASITFSTNEGYIYVWNAVEGEDPFEYSMNVQEYEKLIEKFELFPLFEFSKDAPLKFQRLNENPEFYNRALLLPRPKSALQPESPTAQGLKVGMILSEKPSNSECLVKSVVDASAAAAAGIKANDIIVSLAVNGTNVEMEKFFPLPADKSIRILSLKVRRKSAENKILLSDINVFLPSSLESHLFR